MNFLEKLIEIMNVNPTEYYSSTRLGDILGLKTLSEKKAVEKALIDLEQQGFIVSKKPDKYILLEHSGMVKGKLNGNAKGFAFLVPDDANNSDLFIPNRNLFGALHGDEVLAVIDDKEESGDVGIVVKILSRGVQNVVGTFQKDKNCGFVISDDKRFFTDLYIPKEKMRNAKNGDKVVAKITRYRISKNPEGEITEVLGAANLKGCDVLSIIRSHGIKDSFEKETLNEAKNITQSVTKKDIKNRRDFRNDNIITIDGDDSRDFDDAVSIKKDENGNFHLGVHIADVTEYVKENSSIDKEALERGTSVYFVDRVVPMLPIELSNGICSLNEGVDRLTLSCLMTIDKKGNVIDSDLCESVIKSKHRMTYNNVTRIIEGDKELLKEYKDITDDIFLMKELADIMIKKREDEGAIDFDTPEAKIILDDNGKVVDVMPYERKISNRLIEEFMILANRTVAEKMYFLELPCIYRVHQNPTQEKIENFAGFVNAIGIPFKLPQNTIRSKNFADLLSSLEGNVLYLIVNKVLLRSMQKAKYSAVCDGHFGLSAQYYCHFTSPIRRYPDLFTHRMVKRMLKGMFDDSSITRYDNLASEVSEHTSECEKKADEAERDADDLKKTEFMSTKLGEEFDGVVSGVTSFGIFVELPNTCEGLVRIETLEGDNYNYNDKLYTLSNGNVSYTLGEKVRIKVVTADTAARRVNFVLVD